MAQKVRHILSISGGKDSSALAVYMRDRIPEMEYVFCDTHKELPETIQYIDKLEAYLGKPVVRLGHDGRSFDHYLQLYRGYLPSARMRWCTKHLKIEPFEQFVGDSPVMSYIGIRADEDREGMISTKPNITPRFPFKEDGITIGDVHQILEDAGLGLPRYYEWRSRSGCYFCFFQQKHEWIGLRDNHPDLFDAARSYEKTDERTGERFTWCDTESLAELVAREDEIRREYQDRLLRTQRCDPRLRCLLTDDIHEERACLICDL